MKKENKTKRTDLQRLNAAIDLYDNAPCGFVSFDNQEIIFDINQTLCTWLGYKKEELIQLIDL